MFFTDDDMHQGLKLSLETLSELTSNSTDPKIKRKSAQALAQIILQLMKIQSDKEDWEFLMNPDAEADFKDEEDDDMPF